MAENPKDAAEPELSAFDLPAAPRTPLDVRDVALADIEPLANIRPAHHGIEGLAETMHLDGQLQPCVVRPAPADAEHGKPFELVFGYRRYLAAEALAWDSVRCEVRDVPNDRKRRQLIIENFQREGLSPTAEARAIYELKYASSPPLSNADVARQLGCDPSHISHRLTMLISLSPPRPDDAPPFPHELAARPASPPPAPVDAPDDEDENDAGSSLDPAANRPLKAIPAAEPARPAAASAPVSLTLPGDPAPEPAEGQPEHLDILALVDAGTISASTAEVIASLDGRADQEQLTKLAIRHGWGVKKAAQWAREAKKTDLEQASDDDSLGPVEMLDIADVSPLQRLHARPDLTDSDIERVVVYMQLRNGMDQEMLDFIAERLGYHYETIWDYVAQLTDEQVAELKRRMAVRYITAAHRFFDLEPALKDTLGLPEDASDQDSLDADAALALPGVDFGEALNRGDDDFLALGPETSDDDA